ncbi:helix-turn-helix domain-containing protein [Parvibaculaceae bacterium PLY_AMNH_Bact1]|nr:helix-turn-helix domain-containing protein [Parvibaculaceae bacterium PLY_AMNH_Bact1]
MSTKLMNAKEAANYVGLHYSTLAKKRMEGDGPAYLKLGRKVLYSQSTLDKWLAERTHSSTSDY